MEKDTTLENYNEYIINKETEQKAKKLIRILLRKAKILCNAEANIDDIYQEAVLRFLEAKEKNKAIINEELYLNGIIITLIKDFGAVNTGIRANFAYCTGNKINYSGEYHPEKMESDPKSTNPDYSIENVISAREVFELIFGKISLLMKKCNFETLDSLNKSVMELQNIKNPLTKKELRGLMLQLREYMVILCSLLDYDIGEITEIIFSSDSPFLRLIKGSSEYNLEEKNSYKKAKNAIKKIILRSREKELRMWVTIFQCDTEEVKTKN